MRHICCFCETWASGGIESFLNNVLLHMDLTNAEVDIVASCVKPSVFTAKLEAKGVHFVELSGKLRNAANFIKFYNLVREKQYDVIHFNLFHGLALCYVQMAKKCGVPTRIVHSHGAGLRKSKTKQIKLLLHKIGRILWSNTATEYWACSRTAAEFLFGKKQYCFIPNGIDVDRFRFCDRVRERVRKELSISNKTVVGTVGRLSQEKNHRFLLDVFYKFRIKHPNSILLLVGDGDEKASLFEYANHLGVSDSIIFYGMSTQVNELLCAMDIFVFPSIFEGLGIAVVEAQVSGLVVLCSEGIPEEAHLSDNIVALSIENKDAWVAGIENLLDISRNRHSAADQIKRAGFDSENVAKIVFDKYME